MHGQRELFHTNLLAWFFEEMPDAADAVFKPFSAPGVGRKRLVERERQNMDLILQWPDRAPLVIENKVFAIPDQLQLNKYAKLASAWPGSPPAYCLLAVSAPPRRQLHEGPETQSDWQYLSYGELARRIESSLPLESSYEVETMRQYAALIADLQQLVSAVDVASEQEEVWLPESTMHAVGSSQMYAALQKARAQRIAHEIERKETSLAWTHIEHGMTRSAALVSCFEHIRLRGVDLWAGWQLQGDQFRRAVIFVKPELQGPGPLLREQRSVLARSMPELFVFPSLPAAISAGRNEFNHFAPNFVYQYYKVPRLRIRDLLRAAAEIHNDLSRFERIDGRALARSNVSVALRG